ncbi:ribosomal RNA processing protein 1-like protein [Iris pallida]|uniref:Ribosomal RNA processing protein 1-like protein n=1 Tax=Iris pallida TaxID=29817 RepID=A0AAX6DZR0_IRIPA|nr:ribosomal RNA processing protein 1-like protein [Iris pallida]
MDSGSVSGAAMAKRLASCNSTSRDRAVRQLSSWFPSAAASLSDAELAKIWKGLFYCVWHSDKLPAQLALINSLSSLVGTLDPPSSLRYLDAFLATVRREWSGIDQLRLDKFYLLIRKFVNRSFALLKKHGWNRELLESFVGLLKEKSLLANDKFQANGVNFFLAEVFLDEMSGFLPVAPESFGLLVDLFLRVLERTSDRVLVSKIMVNVFEKLLGCGMGFLCGASNELGKTAIVLGLSEKFLKSASDPETVQGNRKVLFGLRDGFLKLEKDFEKSGLEIVFENLDGGNIVAENAGDGDLVSDDRPAKKRKKEKVSYDGVEKKSKGKKKKIELSSLALESNGEDVASNGDEKETETKSKMKKKKNVLSSSAVESNGEIIVSNGGTKTKSKDKKNKKKTPGSPAESAAGDLMSNDEVLAFDETVISNLQKQFEKVAAEAGMASPATPVNVTVTKKRKRVKSADSKVNGVSAAEKSEGGKSVKKVRFSMKNNLVWKPQTPLPPQSLRLPPSATPRGSALKKGVPPGPVKGSPATVKKIKAKGSSVKKVRKNPRKLHGFSV